MWLWGLSVLQHYSQPPTHWTRIPPSRTNSFGFYERCRTLVSCRDWTWKFDNIYESIYGLNHSRMFPSDSYATLILIQRSCHCRIRLISCTFIMLLTLKESFCQKQVSQREKKLKTAVFSFPELKEKSATTIRLQNCRRWIKSEVKDAVLKGNVGILLIWCI